MASQVEVNEVKRDRSRSMSVEDEMMFRLGRPFEDVSDTDPLGSFSYRRPARVVCHDSVAFIEEAEHCHGMSSSIKGVSVLGRLSGRLNFTALSCFYFSAGHIILSRHLPFLVTLRRRV